MRVKDSSTVSPCCRLFCDVSPYILLSNDIVTIYGDTIKLACLKLSLRMLYIVYIGLVAGHQFCKFCNTEIWRINWTRE